MPNGVYPVPVRKKRHDRPSLSVRLRTWRRRSRYDKSLADGSNSAATQELNLRAQQLTSEVGRNRLASHLEELISEAHDRPFGFMTRMPYSLTTLRPFSFSTVTPQRRADVRRNSGELLALAQRLRGNEPIEAQGAAKLWHLLTDRTGPLYTSPRAAPFTLAHAIRSAQHAITPHDEAEVTLLAA